jgi:hypothetical protein
VKREYQMSSGLKSLLREFASVVVTIAYYAEHRASEALRPGENFGLDVELQDGEPALVVRVSAEGAFKMRPASDEEAKRLAVNPTDGQVKVMELPEDEFWFFEGFRPALSGLSVGPPSFLHAMAFTHLYGMFEAQLADTLRSRLRHRPRLMGGKQQLDYDAIFTVKSKAALLDHMIEREVRRVMQGSIGETLKLLRDRYGMSKLTDSYDTDAQRVALKRNCLLHNGGLIDARLVAAAPGLHPGDHLEIDASEVQAACTTLRKLAYAIDRSDQGSTTE